MAVIRIKSNGAEVPYNSKTAAMYSRMIANGSAEVIGDIPTEEEKKRQSVDVAGENPHENDKLNEAEADVAEVVEKPKRTRRKKTDN
jgi:hypothetical protein